MLSPLAHPIYRRLFLAQVLSLLGTGLATVALGLLAFDLAGADAGLVLGGALAIKMVAYVGVAPLAGAFAHRVPRRALLVALDLLRAGIAVALPFVSEVWQVYLLIFALQAGSAAFTPAFQATIPDILPDEAEYTRALSLSRLAYDLEALASPALAAALLGLVGFHWLFGLNALGFLASAALVLTLALPSPRPPEGGTWWRRATVGVRLYLATPRLRGLLALNLAVAAAGAMVIVNTVVLVKARLGLGDAEVAWALAAYGAGSMAAALALPPLLERRATDRAAMVGGASLLALGLLVGPLAAGSLSALLGLWAALGLGNGLVLTPAGRLLRRSAAPGGRPALFAAQFALSHACWLATYPLAGALLAAGAGAAAPAFLVLAAVAAGGVLAAVRLWPAADDEGGAAGAEHVHADLPPDHPHLAGAEPAPGGGWRHRHPLAPDALHPPR